MCDKVLDTSLNYLQKQLLTGLLHNSCSDNLSKISKKKKLLWWRPCVLKLQNVGMEIFFASFSPLSLCLSLYLYVNYFWWHLLVTASFSCKRITQDQPWRPHFIPPENTRKPLVFCFFRGYKIGTLARNGLRGYIFWGCYGAFSVAMSKLIPAVYV